MLWDSPFTDGMKFIPVCSDVCAANRHQALPLAHAKVR